MTKPADIWMPLYVADYLADTLHLTTAEHGAYMLLIMQYWRGGGPIPDNDARLARVVRATPEEWAAMRPSVAELFKIGDGVWRHKRVDAELAAAVARAGLQRARTEAATEARWKRNDIRNGHRDASVTTSVTESSSPSPSPAPAPSPSSSQIINPETSLTSSTVPAAAKKSRPPAPPSNPEVVSAAWNAYADAYAHRYRVPPTRNAQANALLGQFIRRVPAAEAGSILAWYVASSRGVYVGARHPLTLALRDAEGIRTDWLTGSRPTDTAARHVDRRANLGEIGAKLLAEEQAKGSAR